MRCSAPLASAADRDYLQIGGDERIDFSRQINVAGPKQIVATYRYYGEAPPPVSTRCDRGYLRKQGVGTLLL
jgi:hypothetical protein